MEAIAVTDLSFDYTVGRPILSGLNFAVQAGETITIAGLSGCGKTTLCHLLCGISPQLIPGNLQGEIRLFGDSVANRKTADLAAEIGLVFQDSDNQLFCTTVEDELAFGLENRCLPPHQIAQAITEALERFQITELRETDPARLSGGQKKLVALAAVSMLQPKILIFDEPLTGLDQRGRQLLEDVIRGCRAAGQTIVLVEHDLKTPTAALSDRWLILSGGKIAAFDTPEALHNSRLLYDLELYYDH